MSVAVANPVTVALKAIDLTPGSHLIISGVTWEQYEAFLTELGEARRVPRINYSNGLLEIMSPLPAHERPHRLIGYIVTAILDAQGRDWEDFGSTTFKKNKQAGLEPDTCFYIDKNAERVRDCMRMDLEKDPSPDLAIEADVTSKTTFEAYEAMKIPELWVYDGGKLFIYILQNEQYVEQSTSLVFPNLPILEMLPRLVAQAFQEGTSKTLRDLRKQLAQ
jgi:Uma2 family endonuclease